MTTPRGPHTFSQVVYAFTSFWEFECCGDPWRVRDVVEVELEPGEPSGWDELAPAPIEWYLGRHGSSGNSPSSVRIRRIWEAWALPAPSLAKVTDCVLTEVYRISLERLGAPEPAQPGRPDLERLGWVLELEALGSLT